MDGAIPDLLPWQSALIFTIFIMFGILNAFVMRSRANAHIADNPHLAAGYEKIFKCTILLLTIPFAIILAGILLGQVAIPSTFFNLTNPWILAFLGTILLFDVWAIKSVFFGQGADFMAKHDAGFGVQLTPGLVKLFVIAMLIAHGGFIAAMTLISGHL